MDLGGRLAAYALSRRRIEVAQALDALPDRRMRDEERREPAFEERVDRKHRFRCRAALEVDELRRLLEAYEGIGQAVR